MTARHRIAAADDIAEGGRLTVDVEGRKLVVFRVDGKFFALADRCPHQGGPLSKGDRIGTLTATGPGEHCYERRGMVVRCPWHHWEFDIETGRSHIDPGRIRVKAYETALGGEAETVPAATTYPTEQVGASLYVLI